MHIHSVYRYIHTHMPKLGIETILGQSDEQAVMWGMGELSKWRIYAPGFYKWIRASVSVPVTTQVTWKQSPSMWPGKFARSHQRGSEQKSCTEAFFYSQAGTFHPTRQHFQTTQTQIQGYSLHHRALWLSHTRQLWCFWAKPVLLSRLPLNKCLPGFDALMWSARFVLKQVLVLSLSSNMFMLEKNEAVALEVVQLGCVWGDEEKRCVISLCIVLCFLCVPWKHGLVLDEYIFATRSKSIQ